MKRLLAILALAAVSMSCQAGLIEAAAPNVPGEFDHVATIGGYEFKIFIDRRATPQEAYAVQTDESMTLMDKASNPLSEIKCSDRLVRAYLRSLLGLPMEALASETAQEVARLAAVRRALPGITPPPQSPAPPRPAARSAAQPRA